MDKQFFVSSQKTTSFSQGRLTSVCGLIVVMFLLNQMKQRCVFDKNVLSYLGASNSACIDCLAAYTYTSSQYCLCLFFLFISSYFRLVPLPFNENSSNLILDSLAFWIISLPLSFLPSFLPSFLSSFFLTKLHLIVFFYFSLFLTILINIITLYLDHHGSCTGSRGCKGCSKLTTATSVFHRKPKSILMYHIEIHSYPGYQRFASRYISLIQYLT